MTGGWGSSGAGDAVVIGESEGLGFLDMNPYGSYFGRVGQGFLF